MFELKKPYLLYLGDVQNPLDAKTAMGLKDWCPEAVLGEYARPGASVSLGLPTIAPDQAHSRGIGSLVIGIAPTGGQLPSAWVADLCAAVRSGVDIVSGLHTRLESIPELYHASQQDQAGRLINIREPTREYPCATGRKRSGKRLLTVGTDCALGKKYTALALTRALAKQKIAATFRATGQTGIMIAGSGIAMDALKGDFIAGAAECLSPDNTPEHWDVIEGQGSLYHPAYAAVTLGLLHGSQPDALILCHDPRRSHIDEYPDYPIPDLQQAIDCYVSQARLTNPWVRCVGLAINSTGMSEQTLQKYIRVHEASLNLPVVDPLKTDLTELLNSLLSAHEN